MPRLRHWIRVWLMTVRPQKIRALNSRSRGSGKNCSARKVYDRRLLKNYRGQIGMIARTRSVGRLGSLNRRSIIWLHSRLGQSDRRRTAKAWPFWLRESTPTRNRARPAGPARKSPAHGGSRLSYKIHRCDRGSRGGKRKRGAKKKGTRTFFLTKLMALL